MSKIIYRVWNDILKKDVTNWFLINADGELYIDTINFSDINFIREGEKYINLGLLSETYDFYDKRFKKTLKEYSKLQYGFINDGVKYYDGDVVKVTEILHDYDNGDFDSVSGVILSPPYSDIEIQSKAYLIEFNNGCFEINGVPISRHSEMHQDIYADLVYDGMDFNNRVNFYRNYIQDNNLQHMANLNQFDSFNDVLDYLYSKDCNVSESAFFGDVDNHIFNSFGNLEIIGNINENPEILEE